MEKTEQKICAKIPEMRAINPNGTLEKLKNQ